MRGVDELPLKIISGGQTRVHRGALDAALDAKWPCGGWCPAGRKAEDGSIPARYLLWELPGSDYMKRMRKNVEDSDATLIITFGAATGGIRRTLGYCKQLGKPRVVIDAAAWSINEAIDRTVNLVLGKVNRLNVAGPRASKEPRGHSVAYEVVKGLSARPPHASPPVVEQ